MHCHTVPSVLYLFMTLVTLKTKWYKLTKHKIPMRWLNFTWDLKLHANRAPGWLSWLSVWLWLKSWSHGLWIQASPVWGSGADSSELGACFGFCVSLSRWPSPAHDLSLSLSLSLKTKIKTLKIFLNFHANYSNVKFIQCLCMHEFAHTIRTNVHYKWYGIKNLKIHKT